MLGWRLDPRNCGDRVLTPSATRSEDRSGVGPPPGVAQEVRSRGPFPRLIHLYLAMKHPADREFVVERSVVSMKLFFEGIGYLRAY